MPGALWPYRGAGWDGWALDPLVLASGGWKVADLRSRVDAWIAGATRPSEWVLIDIGANDLGTTLQASYEADLAYVLDAIHAAWPSCSVRVAKPWVRNTDANANTMAGWIDNVLATRGAFAGVGHDERVWLKGADNGATMTYDGTHYSTAGEAEIVNQWRTAMGY